MNSDPISAIYPASDISRRAFTRGLMSSVAILRVLRRKIDRLLKKSPIACHKSTPYTVLQVGKTLRACFFI